MIIITHVYKDQIDTIKRTLAIQNCPFGENIYSFERGQFYFNNLCIAIGRNWQLDKAASVGIGEDLLVGMSNATENKYMRKDLMLIKESSPSDFKVWYDNYIKGKVLK